jgi:hypothetical protein
MMNERIKQLWNQAAESTAAYTSGQNNSWETQVNFMDKFAELIVRECITVVDECNLVDDDPIANIKEHFGVEE